MFDPVKVGLGEFLQAFYAGLVPTTTALHEYVARGFPHSVAWASGRLVDKAEEMIGAWTKNDTAQ
ncbi:MAG: hypothetical protein ACRCYV_02085, partial [Aeromonas sp.]